MKRILITILVLLTMGNTTEVYLQNRIENFGKKAANHAEKHAKSKMKRKVNKTVIRV